MSPESDYGLSQGKATNTVDPPDVDYLPPMPKSYRPRIGLIGAGGISEFHLRAYQKCGFEVVAIASRTRSKAVARRDEFFPEARVYDNYQSILERTDIEVVDVTTHPQDRIAILQHCILAGKHTLSQKPFVLDLDDGRRLVDLADTHSVKLAVNQNGRWAPHFSYLREAVASGLIGKITSIDFSLQWDQTWIAGIKKFENIHHLILFDFGIHWFDITNCLMGGQTPVDVVARVNHFPDQCFRPPAVASVIIQYNDAQTRMSFHGHTRLGEEDLTTVVGTKGTLRSRGPGLNEQPEMQVFLEHGQCSVPLSGCWFESGFQGAMGELLCSIEEKRNPQHGARDNLKSLELCFEALRSADNA